MSRKELSKARKDFIKKRRSLLSKEVDKLQEELLSVILDRFWSRFELSDGDISASGKNITLASALDQVYDEFNQSKGLNVVQTFAKDLISVHDLNTSYFNSFDNQDDLFQRVRNRVSRLTRKNLGITTDGKFSKNGFLEKFINDDQLRSEIKNTTFQAISSGQSHTQLRDTLKRVIAGDSNYQGGFQRHYRTFAYDTYQQVDRANQNMFAQELGLSAFIYSGTVVKATRDFCKKRVGKVFTTEEAKKWTNVRFQGKNRDYNPLTDLGGYNCLHQADFISNQEAARRRKDLEVNDQGLLVSV